MVVANLADHALELDAEVHVDHIVVLEVDHVLEVGGRVPTATDRPD